jgi:beta-glucosidase
MSASIDGHEVCQVYIAKTSSFVASQPLKELKGFSKVFVPAHESRQVHIAIPIKYAASIWDEVSDSWLVESGKYKVLVGNSSAYTPLQIDFDIESSYFWTGL